MTLYQLASNDPAENPHMHSWNHVFVPYCSQDLHSGTVTSPNSSTWGLYFSGHLILEAIVQELRNAGLGQTSGSTVVLSGGSAGGIGTWINVDWLQGILPKASVVGAPIAGFY